MPLNIPFPPQTNPFRPQGQILAVDGTPSLPGVGFSSAPSWGMYRVTGDSIRFSLAGSMAMNLDSNTLSIERLAVGYISSGNKDTLLNRDAANTLALRNSTNAQQFNIYNTFTDASNYERGSLGWTSNELILQATKLGTGSQRAIGIVSLTARTYIQTDTMEFRNSGFQLLWTINIGSLTAGQNSNIWNGVSAIATTATTGFLGVNSCAGVPTGVPASIPTGQIPLVFDTTNLRLYCYTGAAWHLIQAV